MARRHGTIRPPRSLRSVKPEIHVLGLSIKTFGLFFALNFAAWGLLAARRLKELGRPADWAYEIVTVALIGGLVGARAYYLVQNHDSLSPGDIFGGSGLIWYGGLLGGTIAVLGWAHRRDFVSLDLVDIAGPGLALGYAIGRIGCQVSGDGDYGKAWDGPWAMGYPHGTVPTDPGVTVHPTPIYETLTMGLLAFTLWQLRDQVRPGVLFALYLVGAGLERFLVEFLRRNEDVALGLTAAQLESGTLLIIGVIWILVVLRRSGSLLLGEGERRAPTDVVARRGYA
jgi:phosphatidylglycerol:prolipoprotein diacylglycerol transferase